MVTMKIEVSIGEVMDKLSILEIKTKKINDPSKLSNIKKEYDYLYDILHEEIKVDDTDYNNLVVVNQKLWDIEDKIREKEREKTFDDKFIGLARSVYFTNDERAIIKRNINLKYNSIFIEEKSYEEY